MGQRLLHLGNHKIMQDFTLSSPRLHWNGRKFQGAKPMPAGIAPLHPSILSKGVHIYEPFGGSDITILNLHSECGDFVGT